MIYTAWFASNIVKLNYKSPASTNNLTKSNIEIR